MQPLPTKGSKMIQKYFLGKYSETGCKQNLINCMIHLHGAWWRTDVMHHVLYHCKNTTIILNWLHPFKTSTNWCTKSIYRFHSGGKIWIFMFECQKQYLTNEQNDRMRNCFYHENTKLISSSHRVMSFLLNRQKLQNWIKSTNLEKNRSWTLATLSWVVCHMKFPSFFVPTFSYFSLHSFMSASVKLPLYHLPIWQCFQQ